MNVSNRLTELIKTNHARQVQARELNQRAGMSLFPVLSEKQLTALVKTALAGARRIADIQDLDALRLPPLDADLVASVLKDNPDTLMLLGLPRIVDYSTGRVPEILLTEDDLTARSWLQLPDTGVTLPGGRSVVIAMPVGAAGIVRNKDVRAFKERVQTLLNEPAWTCWTSPPHIPLPDPGDQASSIPALVQSEYGNCVVTGEPLLAYGAVTLTHGHRLPGGNPFVVRWFRHQHEAAQERQAAVARLAELQAESQARSMLETGQGKARQLQELMEALACEHQEELGALLNDLRSKQYAPLPTTAAELGEWLDDTTKLIGRAENTIIAGALALELAARYRGAAAELSIRLNTAPAAHPARATAGDLIAKLEAALATNDLDTADVLLKAARQAVEAACLHGRVVVSNVPDKYSYRKEHRRSKRKPRKRCGC